MAVVGFKKEFQRIVADGKKWDKVGKYKEIRGILNIAIDPKVTVNQRISDLDKAILNKDGLVEFETMISILTPVDQSQCNGRLLLDVVNRGNRIVLRDFNQSPRFLVEKGTPKDYLPDMGNGYLMRNGYTIASCGWQVDTPRLPRVN